MCFYFYDLILIDSSINLAIPYSYVEKDKNIKALWNLLSELKIMDPFFVEKLFDNNTDWVSEYEELYEVNFDNLRNMTVKASAT